MLLWHSGEVPETLNIPRKKSTMKSPGDAARNTARHVETPLSKRVLSSEMDALVQSVRFYSRYAGRIIRAT